MRKIILNTRLTTAALLLYVLILSKAEVAHADTSTDCSTDLNVENERYILSGNVVGNCVVTANGITIDGQELYSITGDILAEVNVGPGFDITLEDLELDGEINAGGYQGYDGGDITINNSTIDLGYEGVIDASSGYSAAETVVTGGNITITDSYIYGDEAEIITSGSDSYSNDGGNAGNVIITDSTIEDTTIYSNGGDTYEGDTGGDGGDVTIVRSYVGDIYASGGYGNGNGGDGGDISITESEVDGAIESYGGNGEGSGTDGTLELINIAPVLTVDPEEVSLDMDEEYDILTGVTAEDFLDGDLVEGIQVTGALGDDAGVYEIEFSVEDMGLTVTFNGGEESDDAETSEGMRTITRVGEEDPEPQPSSSSRGGSSSKTVYGCNDTGASNYNQFSSHKQSLCTYDTGTQGTSSQTILNSDMIEKNRELFMNAISAGITLPQYILTALGVDSGSTAVSQEVRDLYVGLEGEDVRALQTLLITEGYDIPAGATGFFVNQTESALSKYQADHGISPAIGYFGVLTRAQMKSAGLAGLWW